VGPAAERQPRAGVQPHGGAGGNCHYRVIADGGVSVAVQTLALPLLLAISLYAIQRGDAFGWFWLMFILGIVGVLWRHSSSKERHIKEMLTFRYASEDMVAARNRALDEAHSLSETKTRFLATMSHEIRTPLHGVLGLARMLADEKLSTQGQKQLELLKSTSEHLLTIINDILDFSRLQAKHLQLHPEATDVADLAQRVLSLAAVTARDKPVQLALDCKLPQDARWMVDPARLRQILLNLLGNAVKFTNEGHVRLTVRMQADPRFGSTQDTLTFEVEDTGVGIPPEHLSRIFDAFHQANNHAAVRAGTGLGLSIARQLCADMGGDLRCDSTVGTGSRFIVRLRLHRTAASASPCDEGASPATQDGTRRWSHVHALVVDDNPVNLIVTEAQLQGLGITVTCQPSAQAALDWLSKHTATIVLMDCHMPDMDGFEATVALRSRESAKGQPAVHVVALTASDEESIRKQALRAGMQGMLPKPFTDEALLAVLNQVLPRSG
jgi:signal transduction histidine kinase